MKCVELQAHTQGKEERWRGENMAESLSNSNVHGQRELEIFKIIRRLMQLFSSKDCAFVCVDDLSFC